MLGNEEILKEAEAIRLTRCIDSCLKAIKDSNCNIDGIKLQIAKRGLQCISTLRLC
jgi:hypothetical protein